MKTSSCALGIRNRWERREGQCLIVEAEEHSLKEEYS